MPGLRTIKSNVVDDNLRIFIKYFLKLGGIFFFLSSNIVQILFFFKNLKQAVPDFPNP